MKNRIAMKTAALIIILLVTLPAMSQDYIDPEWIQVGKTYSQFKSFAKSNGLNRPQLIGGKPDGVSSFKITYQDNTFKKVVVNNRYEYIERSVMWYFEGDTIRHQIHFDLGSNATMDLTIPGGKIYNSNFEISGVTFKSILWASNGLSYAILSSEEEQKTEYIIIMENSVENISSLILNQIELLQSTL